MSHDDRYLNSRVRGYPVSPRHTGLRGSISIRYVGWARDIFPSEAMIYDHFSPESDSQTLAYQGNLAAVKNQRYHMDDYSIHQIQITQ
jgi:hypothetical protein